MLPVVRCLVLAGAVAAGPARPLGCGGFAGLRRACGGPGATEEECKSWGCCYQQALGAPACFHSAADTDVEEACNSPAGNTEDCGWRGIDEDTCRRQGCCYGSPEAHASPRCFRKVESRALQAFSSEGTIPPACVMPDAHRVDCGFEGITPSECRAKDCCYYNGLPGYPFCYFKLNKAPPEAIEQARQCQETDEERIDCGYDGVDKKSCQERGCCYRHAATPGAPFCYYKRNQAPDGSVKGAATRQCIMSDGEREDCGYTGVTPDACRAKGCCYFHSHTPGSPFCYYAARHRNISRASDALCKVPGGERKDCGFGGISAPQCRDSGCCYAHSDVPGAPFCFYKSAPTFAPKRGPAAAESTTTPAAKPAIIIAPEDSSPSSEAGTPSTFVTEAPKVVVPQAPSTTSAPEAQLHVSSTSRIESDVMGSNHFRGAGTEDQDRAYSRRQTLMTLLAAAAISSVIIAALCLKSPPASEASLEEHMPLNMGSPMGAKSKRLEPESDLYREFERQFVLKWDTRTWPTSAGRVVAPPRIAAIFEIDAENRIPAYKAKQREIDSHTGAKIADTPGNETVEFHGARLRCSFQGAPCHDSMCAVCRIVESGSFGCQRMAGEIHFRAGSHAAKGQGLAPGRVPPPESLDDFVSNSAGNAVFVANVLLGTPQIVSERTKGALPPGTHSRIAEKAFGVDEIVVFDEAQAIPRALILLD